jgi:hypothetical protein
MHKKEPFMTAPTPPDGHGFWSLYFQILPFTGALGTLALFAGLAALSNKLPMLAP